MGELITRDSVFIKDSDGVMCLAPEAVERICEIEKQKKKLDKEYEKFKNVIKEGMERYDLKSIESDDLKITAVGPSETVHIDTKKLWDEYKDIAFKCQTTSFKSGYIKITVR